MYSTGNIINQLLIKELEEKSEIQSKLINLKNKKILELEMETQYLSDKYETLRERVIELESELEQALQDSWQTKSQEVM